MNTGIIKAIIVGSIALFFSLIAFNNLTDFESNRTYIQKVLSLHSIQNENISWRAITDTHVQIIVYWIFIIWEIATAIVCWIASVRMIATCRAPPEQFKRVKLLALIGITMGFLKYMIGWVDFGSEWFYLWQSELSGGQIKALLFAILMLQSAIFVSSNNNE